MDLVEYTPLALRTAKPLGFREAITHATLGLASDGGEVLDVLKAHCIYRKELDRPHLIEELGDVMWFVVYAQSLFFRVSIHPNATFESPVPYSIESAGMRLAVMMGRFADVAEDIQHEGIVDGGQVSSILSQIVALCAYIAGKCQLSLWGDVLPANIAKLEARYAAKTYSDEAAIARADKKGHLISAAELLGDKPS